MIKALLAWLFNLLFPAPAKVRIGDWIEYKISGREYTSKVQVIELNGDQQHTEAKRNARDLVAFTGHHGVYGWQINKVISSTTTTQRHTNPQLA